MERKKLPIQIILPDGFLSQETRCGYKISTRMKKVWAVELDLLLQFQKVCSKYNIQYVALWGTALGTIRHSGFIPWDDDIDVAMDRSNYEKFCNVAAKEFTYPYFFQNPITDQRYFAPLARLRNSETTAIIKGFNSLDYNNGIYIDIDILDEIAPNKMQWRIQNLLKHIALMPIKHRIPPYRVWVDLYEKVRRIYAGKNERLGITYSFLESDLNAWISKDDFNNPIASKFEFLDIFIPGNVQQYLARAFGEWQRFPSKHERGAWHAGQVYFDPDVSYKEILK